jgi:hypothetical protein
MQLRELLMKEGLFLFGGGGGGGFGPSETKQPNGLLNLYVFEETRKEKVLCR